MSDAHHRDVGEPTPAASGRVPYQQRISEHEGVSTATLRAIVDALLASDQPAMTQCELATTLDCSATTIRRATDALETDGVLRSLDWGGTRTYYLAHPDSEWPVPDDVDLVSEQPFDTGADSMLGVLLGDPPLCYRNLCVAGAYLTIMEATGALVALLTGRPALATIVVEGALVTLTTAALIGVVWALRQYVAPRFSQ